MKHIITLMTLTLLLTSTVSCGGKSKKDDTWFSFGKKEKVEESAFKTLEMKFEDLKAQVTGGKTHSEKAAERAEFWQATAGVLIVVAGFALVFGAALGSQARRVRKPEDSTVHPTSTTTE